MKGAGGLDPTKEQVSRMKRFWAVVLRLSNAMQGPTRIQGTVGLNNRWVGRAVWRMQTWKRTRMITDTHLADRENVDWAVETARQR